MSATFPPPKRKPRKMKPLPPGTLVIPKTESGVWLSSQHMGHVFEVQDAQTEQFTNSGWLQMVRCVSCHTGLIGPFDAEFFQKPVDKDYIVAAMKDITRRRNRLLLARRELSGRVSR